MLPGLTRPLGSGLGVTPQANGISTSRWSLTDHYTGIVPQLSGLTFTNSTGTAIRGTKAGAGRVYLEFTLAAVIGGANCGIANASADLSTVVGFDSAGNALGYIPATGRYAFAGATSTFANNITYASGTGDVTGMALDGGARLIWFNVHGVWIGTAANADPVAGVGGIPAPPGALFPAASVGTSLGGFLINTGGFAFTNPIPSGYQAWG